MNDVLVLILSMLAGMGMGALYFYGLWLTLKQLPFSRQPVLLTLGSFLVRVALCLFGFYMVVRNANLEGVAASLVGFMAIKIALVLGLRPGQKSLEPSAKEAE